MGTANYLGGAQKLATAAKPYAQAAQTGLQASQSLQPDPLPAPPPINQQPAVGPQTLGQLVGEMKLSQQQEMDLAEQERRARRSRGLLGG